VRIQDVETLAWVRLNGECVSSWTRAPALVPAMRAALQCVCETDETGHCFTHGNPSNSAVGQYRRDQPPEAP